MDAGLITAVIWLIAAVVVVGGVAYGVWRAKKRAREISQAAFGTDSLIEGWKQTEVKIANTPKSVSAATSLYLPQIMKDFPEFNYNDMRIRAENVLVSYLRAIDEGDAHVLTEGSWELRDALRLRLGELKNQEQTEQFDDIKVHRTEIARYEKRQGRCTIVFQSAVQYRHALLDAEGNVIKGNKDTLEQSRYNVKLVYIQDEDKVADDRDRADSLHCPNCGAPVTNLGAKSCAYCGSALEPYNIRVWAFHKVSER